MGSRWSPSLDTEKLNNAISSSYGKFSARFKKCVLDSVEVEQVNGGFLFIGLRKKNLLEAGCHGTFSHGNCAMRRIDFSLWTSIHSAVLREPLFPDVSNKGLGCEMQRQSSKNSGKRGKSKHEESVREYLQLNK